MDTKEKDYDADALLAELRESLKTINEPKAQVDTDLQVNLGGGAGTGYDWMASSADTITLSGLGAYNNTIVGGGYSSGTATITGTPGPFTVGSGTGINYPNSIWSTTASNTIGGQLHLDGEDADITLNGKSLAKTLETLEQRLNILNPNPELEKEWNELKELGDKYRALEAKLKEQGEMWAKLKAMPPPEQLY